MYKNDIITAKDGKFTFPNLGDEYKYAIMLTFAAIEKVSVDYAIIKVNPDKKDMKYSFDNLSKEIIDAHYDASPALKTITKAITNDEELKEDMFTLEEIKEIADYLTVYYENHKNGD